MPQRELVDDAFLDFIEALDIEELISIPGVLPLLLKYYTEVHLVEAMYHPIRNPAGVVKTAQDERDWKRAKEYYARGARGPERSWRSPDWATVMVIYKNIKAKRKQRRG